MMDIVKKNKFMQASIAFFGGLFFLLGAPLLTQEEFNPSSVRPSACKPGSYKCGMNPMEQEEVEKIPLATSTMISHRGLPSRVDFSSNMPPVSSQGRQGSCVAWATGYAAKSYLERLDHNWGYDAPVRGGRGTRVFSPAFIYNQINRGRDNGSFIGDAMQLSVSRGVAPWSAMPYTDKNYTRRPNSQAFREARKYKNKSFRRIPANRLSAIKAELAAGNPVVFGIPIDQGFYDYRGGVYARRSGRNYGGHAMTFVGYDDSKRASDGSRGALKFINSWGTRWGENGYGWISYRLWTRFNRSAYVPYDEKTGGGGTVTKPEITEEEKNPVIENPRNVSATKGTYSDKVVISWSRVNGAIAYALGRAPANNLDALDYLGYSRSTSYADTQVEPGISYVYVVLAIDENRKTSDSKNVRPVEGYASVARPVVSRPDRVVGLELSSISRGNRSRVQLQWSPAAGASKYYVYRGSSVTKGMRRIATVRSEGYVDGNPQKNAINYYAVSAANGQGEGPRSNSAEISIAGKTTKPSRPSGLRATRGRYKKKIVIQWNPVQGANLYYIYRYNHSVSRWEGPKSTRSTIFVDKDLSVQSGTWFTYAVAAANSAGVSPYSKYAPGRTNPNAERGGAMVDPPDNVRIKINKKKGDIELRWDAVKKAEQYYVFRASKKGDFAFVKSLPANTRVFREKLPKRGELFFYKLRSKVLLGESADSKTVAAFVNVKKARKPLLRHRAMQGQGFDRFAGKWTGFYWQGGEPKNYEVRVSGMMGNFQVEVFEGKKRIKTVEGKFPSYAKSLVAKDFKMELLAELTDAATLELVLRKKRLEIGLNRQK